LIEQGVTSPPTQYMLHGRRVENRSLVNMGQYLAKIWTKVSGLLFGHPVV